MIDRNDIDQRILDAVSNYRTISLHSRSEAESVLIDALQRAQDEAVKEALVSAEEEIAEYRRKIESLTETLNHAIEKRKVTDAALLKQLSFKRMNDEFVQSLYSSKNPFKRLAYKWAKWPAPESDVHKEHYITTTEVMAELARQDIKWGEQNHPNGTGEKFGFSEELANEVRDRVDSAFARGNGTWADILMEEFYEALAEENPRRLKEELIQVAAVCVQWVIALKRQRPKK